MSDNSCGGDDFAFPAGEFNGGMTYRQWLIGQALNGLASNPEANLYDAPRIAIYAADNVILELKRGTGVK